MCKHLDSEAPSCPLCMNDGRVWFTKRERTFFRCINCGFGYIKPETNPNLPERLDEYEAAYRKYLEADPGDRSDFLRLFQQLEDLCKVEGRKWLDVGCGTGKFVRFLNEHGVKGFGLEPSRPLFNRYLEGCGPFRNCSLEEIGEPEYSEYDIVSFLDVLEHIDTPLSTLQRAHRVLKPGGRLIIEIPAVDGLLSRLLGKAWPHFHRYHLSYFSSHLLKETVCSQGFRLNKGWWRGRHFSVGYLLQYLMEFGLQRQGVRTFDGGIFEKIVYLNFFDTYCAVFQKTRR